MVSWFDEIGGNFWYSKLDVSLLFGVFLKAILEEIFFGKNIFHKKSSRGSDMWSQMMK